MSREYIDHLKQLFTEVHENTMKDLRSTDKEYSEILRSIIEESKNVEGIIDCLDDEDKEFFLRYKERRGRIEWIEREMLYFQGLKDCVKLLRFLEII
ncbi:hypothetical protein [Wukongibacter sp. M2B1]|uniref:hypothetical protein n=1 Tax=Wukongibacter sp. M2B1 TaxID=3088895 RepID=UPI003D7B2D35